MQEKSNGISSNLHRQYNDLLPLLSYLKARVKYDTVRWIRTFGAKDDLIFSTRIKSFERTFDKLARKKADLLRNTNLQDLILSKDRLLDDMVGIRFVCFEPHQIVRLVSHFLTTQQVEISHPEFYRSLKSDSSNPVHKFLLAAGFKANVKLGREYEDVSFIFRFRHPIDLYFDSGRIPYSSPHDKTNSPDKLQKMRGMFDKLLNEQPKLISSISEFPIETQIVTATQHIYNRIQRPLYEHVFQKKDNETPNLHADVGSIEDHLKILKMNLMTADESALSIHTKLGARFDFVPRVNSALQYGIEGRLPADLLSMNKALRQINDQLLQDVFSGDSHKKRVDALDKIIELINALNQAIRERGSQAGDIADRNVLDLNDLAELSHPHIYFWSLQRIVLLVISNILLFSNSEPVKRSLIEHLNKHQAVTGDEERWKTRVVSERLVLERIFEKLKHTDNAIVVLLRSPQRIKRWRDGYFANDIFLDPVVLWRYATYRYKNREYLGALQEINVGLEIWNARELERAGKLSDRELPEKVLFRRRRVEYELCHKMTQLRYSSVSVAGIFEMCHLVTAKSGLWIRELKEVRDTTHHPTEQARALCYEILIQLCVASTSGLKSGQGLTGELGDCVDRFKRLEVSREDSAIALKTWWLLAKAATTPTAAFDLLETFDTRIKTIEQHPAERNQFEILCSQLIRLWLEGEGHKPRGFGANTTEAVIREVEGLRAVQRDVQRIRETLIEVLHEVRAGKPMNDSAKESLQNKLSEAAIEGAEKIAVDTAVAGLRHLLGF